MSNGVTGESADFKSFTLFLRLSDPVPFALGGVSSTFDGEPPLSGVSGSSSVFTLLGDAAGCRCLLLSLTGDLSLFGEDLLSALPFESPLDLACVLFLGTGLIVSSAKLISTSPRTIISSFPFTLQEIEQYRFASL